MERKRCLCAAVAAACALLAAGTAHAQFSELSRGLYLAGFRIDAAKNPITGGADFTTSKSFFPGSNTLRFGVGTLTLNGALTINGGYEKCPFKGGYLGISSSAGAGTAPAPISYTLSIPRAVETITVTGTATINTSIDVDETGFYHRVINIDNRGTVKTTGLVPSENNLDFTLGPIDQTGNIYLQALGLLGGNKDTAADTVDAASIMKMSEADLAALDLNDPEQLEAFVNAALVQGITQAAVDPSVGKTTTVRKEAVTPVPEPATLALLAVCGSICLVGFGRRRAS